MPIIFRNKPVTEPFTFESIGHHWVQDHVSRPGGFPFYHFLQTENGTGRITTASGTHILRKNEGILIAPFLRHSYEAETPEWVTKFATFTGISERAIPQITGNRQEIFINAERGLHISELIDHSISLYESRSPDSRQLSVNCYALLIHISDFNPSASLSEEPLYQNYVLPIIQKIEIDYALPLTVEELSRSVFITPQYLTRLFHRYLNCSAYEYLTSFRLGKAKELLITEPSMTVQAIACRTGFSDASHFISVFRKAVGMTPLDFRRIN